MFKYSLGQEIVIKALELTGVVHSRMDNLGGCQEYRVIYWADGKRNSEWVYDHEITEQSR